MTDTKCIACEERLATVTTGCVHRQYCSHCFERTQEESNGAQNCALCRQSVVQVADSRAVQFQPVTVTNSLINYDVLKKDYPFGVLLFGKETTIATQDLCQIVREAIEAVQKSTLKHTDLKKALRQRLTMEQYDMVFAELIKNEDLHVVLKRLDVRKFEQLSETIKVQQMVVQLVESPDMDAVAYRAVVVTGVSASLNLMLGLNGFGQVAFKGTTLMMFLGTTGLELYQWSKKQQNRLRLGVEELAKNIGENAVGAVSEATGALVGGKLGALVGSAMFPGIGTVVGGVIGAIVGGLVLDATGRLLYRKIFPDENSKTKKVKIEETSEFDLSPRELAEKSAAKFGINIDLDSFEEAHARFRRCLLANHPDKHPDVNQEERQRLTAETADILACWMIVREYYKDRGDVEISDCDEGFVMAFMLKVRDTASQKWRVVRTFFNDATPGFEVDPGKEKLQMIKFYI